MVSTSTSPMSTASKPVAAARYPAAVSVLPVDVEYSSAAFISGEPARATTARFCAAFLSASFIVYLMTPPTNASHRKRCNDRRSAGVIGLLLVRSVPRVDVLNRDVLRASVHLLVRIDHLRGNRHLRRNRRGNRGRSAGVGARIRRHEPTLVELALIGHSGREEGECDHR